MHDIERLRKSHPNNSKRQQQGGQPVMSELQGLRSHKMELDSRLEELQCARRDLMEELDELMKLLKVQPSLPTQQTHPQPHHYQQFPAFAPQTTGPIPQVS